VRSIAPCTRADYAETRENDLGPGESCDQERQTHVRRRTQVRGWTTGAGRHPPVAEEPDVRGRRGRCRRPFRSRTVPSPETRERSPTVARYTRGYPITVTCKRCANPSCPRPRSDVAATALAHAWYPEREVTPAAERGTSGSHVSACVTARLPCSKARPDHLLPDIAGGTCGSSVGSRLYTVTARSATF
jgi:hypothetical protein